MLNMPQLKNRDTDNGPIMDRAYIMQSIMTKTEKG